MILFRNEGIPFIFSANSFGMIPSSAKARMASASLSLTFHSERVEAI